jgi:hypothetical protein
MCAVARALFASPRALEPANAARLSTTWMERPEAVDSLMGERFSCAEVIFRLKSLSVPAVRRLHTLSNYVLSV